MDLPLYQVDAFILPDVNRFSGNPAAVVPLREWISDAAMQDIAAENNLAETAFFVLDQDDVYHIRWFTPTTEVDLCGHAALAAAHVIALALGDERDQIPFRCLAGELVVNVIDDVEPTFELDFPRRDATLVTDQALIDLLEQALGQTIISVGASRDTLVQLENEAAVAACNPDFALLAKIDSFAVMVTAPADDEALDFVCRFFAPRQGINEDPVTGSSYCTLAPYWAERLNSDVLKARQLSRRGGEVSLEVIDERVLISGQTYHYLQGVIRLPS
ncbi:PhzF family phenazine biosynthesis protein [Thalassolituus sp.]|jgi:PhzF family phenazine biosynthesis protein|uniref:PhzF family phenazine biosynthesis protein n=1 Tax=Thalassolituus sp. TaxID=2030822 RepID=UPI0032D983CF